LQDGGAVVGHGDVSIGRNEDLVETTGSERGFDDVGDGASGEDVRLDGFVAKLALLLSLA
jgi:hypothetical protein